MFNPRGVKTIIVDEADEMITKESFAEDLDEIIGFMPKNA